jgi:hypothetical protein
MVQIWPGRFVCKQVTVCPGNIWITLYYRKLGTSKHATFSHPTRRPNSFVFGCLIWNLFITLINTNYSHWMPVPVAERSKARVYGRSLAGVAGSNPPGGMDVCLLWLLCCQVEVYAKGRSLVQRSPTDCGVTMCVWSRNLTNEAALARVGLLRQRKTRTQYNGKFLITCINADCSRLYYRHA